MGAVTEGCEPSRVNLGAYVLGALDAADRARTETHLAGCPACRDELVELAGLPGLLRRLAPAAVEALRAEPDDSGGMTSATPGVPVAADAAGPDGPAGRAVTELARRRSAVRRHRLLSVAAGVALVGALLAGGELREHSFGSRTVAAADPGTHVWASVRMSGRASGTVVSLRLSGVGEEERCSLVAIGDDGRRDTAASWVASYSGQAQVRGQTALAMQHISAFEVVTPAGRELVRVPVRGPA